MSCLFKAQSCEIFKLLYYDATVCRICKPDELALREKCPNTEFLVVRISLYSVRVQENTDQKKLSRLSELRIVEYWLFYSITEDGMFKTEKKYTDGLPCLITSAVG